ncbi:MAG: glycosyltransferase family 2 protein [Promethearchaeota archaeon]
MLSIILLNYNNTFHTKNCLISLQKQTYKNFEIILVDNNSKQIFREELQNFLKTSQLNGNFLRKIRFIKSNKRLKIKGEKNLGFTGGTNLGLKKSKGDLILLLNNDTFQDSDFLESMVELFDKYKDLHIAQPKICFYPEKDIIWANGGKINKFSINIFKNIDNQKKDDNSRENLFKIDYATGCALFIRREILRDIGVFDNIYFMYCEESDLCYRAFLKGYKNVYCNPKTTIYHNRKPGFSISFKKFYFRNRTIFCFKHFHILIIIWQFLLQFAQLLIYSINFKTGEVDSEFIFNSIKGIIEGASLGIKRRIEMKNKKNNMN